MAADYGLTWPGKDDAARAATTPTRAVLVPDDATAGRHLFVEGDNLDALKLLRPSYAGQVKLVYADPPYNTGQGFVYADRFGGGGGAAHAGWLSMMLPRLLLARDLLTDDGLIAISIGDQELSRLVLMCDEVFGERNFVATVIVQANKGGRDYRPLAQVHEYVVLYARDITRLTTFDLPQPDRRLPYADDHGPYDVRELRNRNPRFGRHNRPNLFYAFHVDPDVVDHHGFAAVSLSPTPGRTIETFPRNSRGEDGCWRWGSPKAAEAIVPGDPAASTLVAKRVRTGGWNVYEKDRRTTAKAKTIWDEPEVRTEAGTRLVREIFGAPVFDHPKPLELVRKLVAIGTRPGGDDLVLDFFAGSGTTHHAVCVQDAQDGGRRRTISVNAPDPTPEGSEARRAGFETVSAITLARLRWVGEHVDGAAAAGLEVRRVTT